MQKQQTLTRKLTMIKSSNMSKDLSRSSPSKGELQSKQLIKMAVNSEISANREIEKSTSELMIMDKSIDNSIHGGGQFVEPQTPDLNRSMQDPVEDSKSFNIDIQDDLKNETDVKHDEKILNTPAVAYGEMEQVKKPMSATKIQEKNESSSRRSGPSKTVGVTPQARNKNRNGLLRKNSQSSVMKGGSTNRSHKNSRSRSRNSRSDFESNSMNNISVIEGELHLSEKLQKYINRIAATCMGQMYASRYIKDWRRKNA